MFTAYLQEYYPHLTNILTRLPDQVSHNTRMIQLKRAVTGSHLQQALSNYLSITDTTADFLTLVKALRQADPNIHTKRSSSVGFTLAKCSSCEVLKHKANVQGIKSHPANINCPDANVTALTAFLTSTKKKQSYRSGSASSVVTSTSDGPKVNYHSTLPANFDHTNYCSNCYLSGQANGAYSSLRKQHYQTHASHTCLWVELRKNKTINPRDIADQYKHRYVNASTHQLTQEDNYRPSRSNTYVPSHQARANHTASSSRDHGYDKRQRSPSPLHRQVQPRSHRYHANHSQEHTDHHSRERTDSPQTAITHESNNMYLQSNQYDDNRSCDTHSHREHSRDRSRSRSR